MPTYQNTINLPFPIARTDQDFSYSYSTTVGEPGPQREALNGLAAAYAEAMIRGLINEGEESAWREYLLQRERSNTGDSVNDVPHIIATPITTPNFAPNTETVSRYSSSLPRIAFILTGGKEVLRFNKEIDSFEIDGQIVKDEGKILGAMLQWIRDMMGKEEQPKEPKKTRIERLEVI